MSKVRAKITVLHSGNLNETTVLIGDELLNKLKMSTQASIQLRCGSAHRDVQLQPVKKSADLRIHSQLAADLGIYHDRMLWLSYKPGTKDLVLGPLVGVLLRKVHAQTPDRLFGKQSLFCKEMTEACEKIGAQVFFFTKEDLSSNLKAVSGWCHIDNQWVHKKFPVPGMVYNRLTSRVIENSAKVQHFMKTAKATYDTQIFNEKYLSKHEVFQALRREQHLLPALPESRLLHHTQVLKNMLSRYSTVFIKPVRGSLGRGITRIRHHGSEGYVCDQTSANGLRRNTYPTFAKLAQVLRPKVKSKSYQIQQGIDLVTVGGRPVDFRAIVQRGATGTWGVTSIVARIASNQTFVSNLARGGTLSSVNTALDKSNVLPQHRLTVQSKLRKYAVEIAKGIEQQIPYHFAELGIDLAADVRGRVWLIEVNSKPSKEDNSPLQPGKIRPSVKQIIYYVMFLHKQQTG